MVNSEYRQPTHREELERELVHGASIQIANNPENAASIAKGIKTVLDELSPKMASGIVIPPIGAPSAGATAASLLLPVVDPGPDALEREIQAAGADKAPRVTPAALKDEIVSEHYFTAADGARMSPDGNWPIHSLNTGRLGLLTFCVLVLRNGFTVHGVSACASPENFNAKIGRSIARENAEREIWPLLGFRLRDELARTVLTEGDVAADASGTCRPDNHTSACTACKQA
ncbi:MAG: Gp49 family protein [Acidovorax sp.]|uniref:Gp49 family protein n=1 Tax=Acidovorax sp. TaxID=1872122 RepID=UPI003918CD80